ncbi:hypothetical protein [Microviridae sp.]|nr:hypothetical protein [Microviridae sp.]
MARRKGKSGGRRTRKPTRGYRQITRTYSPKKRTYKKTVYKTYRYPTRRSYTTDRQVTVKKKRKAFYGPLNVAPKQRKPYRKPNFAPLATTKRTILSQNELYRALICAKRKIRKEVLFATNQGGAHKTPRKRDNTSQINCKG